MASWLYECLCEAELAQYYPHFTAVGLQKIEELAKVTMKDYSRLGVHDMNDRKRLFQLIKIIKIMQEEDRAASSPDHLQTNSLQINSQKPRPGPRRQLQFESPADSKDSNGFEICNLSDFSANEQKSSYLKVLEHMLPDDSQYHIKTRFLNATAAGSYVQTETPSSLFSANGFSPIPGDGDIPIIQRVSHVTGYNYGIPHSCIRPDTSEKENPWTELEKIRVCVRKRPLGIREVRRGEINIITVEDKETLLVHEKKEAVDLTQYILQHVFYFDEVFGESCTNRDVYMKTTHPLIQHIFNGGNATCFAYGQTGAGKTYTMIGTHQNPGLYALAAKDIFRQLEVSQPRRRLFVWISFYEIYCGQLYDLLNRRKRLFAREDSKHVVQIVGLRELQVDSVELLLEVILKGSKERSTGATGVNADSSRSHAIIQIQIKDSAKRTFGRISFIDLAGSERAADARDSDRQTKMEGAEINQSLLALKECIRALDQEHTHTPFRQSKLTQVLKDSFIGDAKTCMIANISPSHVATEHTLNTLRYADRVKELKKGMKCCSAVSGRSRTSGNMSPKRIQSSPGALPGDKCSPKKVKLGLQPPLAVAPGSSRGKASPLASHPPNVPLAAVPKAPGKRGVPRASPLQEGSLHSSPGKAPMHGGQLPTKKAEESPPCPGRSPPGVSSGRGLAPGKLPAKGRKVQPVRPVQKQLVSRSELSCGQAQPRVPPQQQEREAHLRLYHQQFQRPPLLQPKLHYQPLEQLLCQYRAQAGPLRHRAPSPPATCHPESPEGTPAEEPDDSDFSEDSFSHVASQRGPKQREPRDKSRDSFFLHQSEPRPQGPLADRRWPQGLSFSPRPEGDGKVLQGAWLDCWDPRSPRGAALEPREAPWDWHAPSSGPSNLGTRVEKPSCPQGSLGHSCTSEGTPAAAPTEGAFGAEQPQETLDEDSFSLSLSHMATSGSPDQRDGASASPREACEDSPAPAARAGLASDSSPGEGSRGELGSCSDCTSGLMAPLTVSLLENPDDEGASPVRQLAQSGTTYSLLTAGTRGPPEDHTASLEDQEEVLPVTRATGSLWLSSSPPDNKPGAELPPLSPSPIRHQPPAGEADLGATRQSQETMSFPQEPTASEHYDADAEETEVGSSGGFPGTPFGSLPPRGHGPALSPPAGSVKQPMPPWAQESVYPAGRSWQEQRTSTDCVRSPCFGEDPVWLQQGPVPRSLARPGSPLACTRALRTTATLPLPSLEHAQQVVIRAHQEQLDEMAELSFKEETLMSRLAPHDFEDFVVQLDEIMALKSKCIQSLRSQLQLYLACHRLPTAPKRTVVS
ncbi:kinesin-like protein KIF24 [Sorex fumeus]|uniref:kinesin-like protein KIF24 n=1 Tax=Sorex fumeus TaxID=62283 RepID=UPI0024AD5DE0|nr:kinesin-like protein KIF24 [Sorex fumeus]